jgi:hypothetical protein
VLPEPLLLEGADALVELPAFLPQDDLVGRAVELLERVLARVLVVDVDQGLPEELPAGAELVFRVLKRTRGL